MRQYLAICTQLVEDRELIPLAGGMSFWTDNTGTACNSQFQGLAATCSKAALYQVVKESYVGKSVLNGNCRPVVFLHDEILSEVREEVASECAEEIARIMVSAMRKYTPDVAVKAEPALCRRWMKEMSPVRSKSGKLLPWWPTDKDGNLTWDWEPDRAQMVLDTEMRNS